MRKYSLSNEYKSRALVARCFIPLCTLAQLAARESENGT